MDFSSFLALAFWLWLHPKWAVDIFRHIKTPFPHLVQSLLQGVCEQVVITTVPKVLFALKLYHRWVLLSSSHFGVLLEKFYSNYEFWKSPKSAVNGITNSRSNVNLYILKLRFFSWLYYYICFAFVNKNVSDILLSNSK